MGFGALVNSVGDGLEHLAQGAEHAAGSAAKDVSDVTGSALNAVGLHSAAQHVEEFGDHLADDLGATVAEAQLGQSTNPKDLVHGDAGAIEKTAQSLRRFQAGFEDAFQALSQLETGEWESQAAEAFRAKYLEHPKRWADAADACGQAAAALEVYAHTVTWAQGQAEQAITVYAAAKKATDAHNKQVDDYNKLAADWNRMVAQHEQLPAGISKPVPPPSKDPGAAGREQAQQVLDAARKQRDQAAAETARAVSAAMALAPKEPSFLQRMTADAHDLLRDAPTELAHFGGGIVKGVAGIVDFARDLNPLDPYNLTHPATYLDGLSTTAAGLVHAANNPTVLLKSLVGSGWSSDPMQALGNLVPNTLLTVGTGGAGAAETVSADVAENVAERSAVAAGEDAAVGGVNTTVTEQALHAGSMSPEAERAFLESRFPGLEHVNADAYWQGVPGHDVNCTNVVQAVDKYLDGTPVQAAPKDGPGFVDGSAFGVPGAHLQEVGSYDAITRDMAARGVGARGVVGITRSGGMGHVFNVLTTKDGVVFLDGQTGRLATLENHAGVSGIQYMPYR